MGRPSPSTKKVTSIWLEPEIDGYDDKLKMFYCFNCRMPLIEYQGNIINIVPGRHPYTPSTVHKCKGSVQRKDGTWEECGMMYSFIGSAYTKIPEAT